MHIKKIYYICIHRLVFLLSNQAFISNGHNNEQNYKNKTTQTLTTMQNFYAKKIYDYRNFSLQNLFVNESSYSPSKNFSIQIIVMAITIFLSKMLFRLWKPFDPKSFSDFNNFTL